MNDAIETGGGEAQVPAPQERPGAVQARALQKRNGPERGDPARDDLTWVVGLWLVLAAVHSPVLAGVVTYFHNDLWSWFLPVHEYLRRELWQGNLLPWCPWVSCGYPLSAEPQTGIFYPLNLIFALPLPLGQVMGLALFAHYGLAATGAFALARRFGASGLASFAGALVFAASGFMVAHLHHYAILSAAAWLPWAWYAGFSYRLRPRRRLLVWLWWCSAAQLLAGQPQVWLLTFGALLLWLLLAEALLPAMRQTRPHGSGLLARWGLPMVAIMLGAGLAGVTLLPARELLAHSVRSAPSWDFVTSYALNRAALASFFGLHLEAGDDWEYQGFAGLTTLLLAALAVAGGRDRARVRLLLALLVVALFMGMAAQNPLYRLIVHIPLLNAFRCAARWLLIVSACFSLLAAWMLTEMGERKRRLQVGLAGVLAVEVLLFAVRCNPVMPAERLEWSVDRTIVQHGWGRVASVLPETPPPGERAQFELGKRLLAPNVGLLWGIPTMSGYMPLQLQEFERLRPVDPEKDPKRCALLGTSTLLAPVGSVAAEGWVRAEANGGAKWEGVSFYRNRYYRGWHWFAQPDPRAAATVYGGYNGRLAYVNCSPTGPNRLVFSFVRAEWLSATISGKTAPVEDDGHGLCAVSVSPNCGLVLLHYHHPRLREGLLVTSLSLLAFCAFMLSISYFRQRPRHAIRKAQP